MQDLLNMVKQTRSRSKKSIRFALEKIRYSILFMLVKKHRIITRTSLWLMHKMVAYKSIQNHVLSIKEQCQELQWGLTNHNHPFLYNQRLLHKVYNLYWRIKCINAKNVNFYSFLMNLIKTSSLNIVSSLNLNPSDSTTRNDFRVFGSKI